MLVTSMLVATVVSLSRLHHFTHIMCSYHFIHTFTDSNHFIHTFTDSNCVHTFTDGKSYTCLQTVQICHHVQLLFYTHVQTIQMCHHVQLFHTHIHRQYRCVTVCSYHLIHTFTQYRCVAICVYQLQHCQTKCTSNIKILLICTDILCHQFYLFLHSFKKMF